MLARPRFDILNWRGMPFIRNIRTTWFGLPPITASQDKPQETEEISSDNQFIFDLSAPPSYFQKAEEASLPSPQESLRTIAVKFIGFEKRFKSVLAPVGDFQALKPSEIRGYFVNTLPQAVELARMRPRAAHNVISDRSAKEQTIYHRLVGIACGDMREVLQMMDDISKSGELNEKLLFDCLREVGRYRPYETSHLMMRLFEGASTKIRLAIMNEFASSPVIGNKQAVGDLFVKLLEKSTEEERRDEIYPALLSTIHSITSLHHTVQVKRGFLAALLRGSMTQA